jgi:hypothetical protein
VRVAAVCARRFFPPDLNCRMGRFWALVATAMALRRISRSNKFISHCKKSKWCAAEIFLNPRNRILYCGIFRKDC